MDKPKTLEEIAAMPVDERAVEELGRWWKAHREWYHEGILTKEFNELVQGPLGKFIIENVEPDAELSDSDKRKLEKERAYFERRNRQRVSEPVERTMLIGSPAGFRTVTHECRYPWVTINCPCGFEYKEERNG